MLETEQSYESPCCSSATQNDHDEETFVKNEGNNLETRKDPYESIFEELVTDAMWELCFEVHRAVKLGYSFLEETDKRKCLIVEDTEQDIYGQKLKSKIQTFQISCPSCKNKSCATKFASHLAKCIGISGRTSSRAATKKIAASNVFESDLDENDYDSDSSINAKRAKKRKSARRKAKVQGNAFKSSSETNANYQEMTYEKRKDFLNQKCGVISKRTNKMCMNPIKCSQHTDEQRRDVRQYLLCDMVDQLANDGQIDVDTVDEGNGGFPFIQSMPATSTSTSYKSPMSSTSGFTGEEGSTSKFNSAQLRSFTVTKRTDFDTNNSASNSPHHVMPTGSSFESA